MSDQQSDLYFDTRDRCVSLFRSLDTEQISTIVPLNPDWTVKDVAAHVCGLNADLANGMREGLGSDSNTAVQVEIRASDSLADVCDEWLSYDEFMRALVEKAPVLGTRLGADLTLHMQDVQHALRLPVEIESTAVVDAALNYVEVQQGRMLEAHRTGLGVDLGDAGRHEPPEAATTIWLSATAYDFLRSATGRRSRAQVEGLDWSSDPSAFLAQEFSPYGQLPAEDVSV